MNKIEQTESVDKTKEKGKEEVLKPKKEKKQNEKTDESLEQKETKKQDIQQEETEKVQILEDEKLFEEKTDKLNKYAIIVGIVSAVLLIGFLIFSTIFGLMNRNSNKIVSGVYIQGIDISKLTYDEAYEKVIKIFQEKEKQNVTLVHNEVETSLSQQQIEGKFGIKDALDLAYSIGRSGKILKDNYAIITTKIKKTNINPSFTYNEKILNDFIESTSENLPDAVKKSSYFVDGTQLIIDKGQNGAVINKEECKNNIIKNMMDLEKQNEVIQIPVEIKEPEKIDLNKLHDEIYKEPRDAYYTKDPFNVYPHVNGVDFAISIEEANNLLNNDQQEIIIPLKITKPNITTNQIGTEAFPNLLATYSTTFSTKNGNRSTNIRLASNKINGVVLMPGEEFSYNAVVGKRTAAAGYKTAAVYVGGKVEEGIGGGICQVSSTLYNTALRANLEIVKRSNHRFATGYVPLSTDATVSWGGPEFIFKNSRKYPIKIVSTVNGGRIKIDIYGLKEDVEYDVVIKSETLQTIPMKTEYRVNKSLPVGSQKVVQKGHVGYKSRAYRILKLNGKVVSTQLLSTDTYAQLSTIIEKN